MLHDDLLAPDVVRDPSPYFHALREQDPVHWNARSRLWVLTRHADVVPAFRDPRLSADRVSPSFERRRRELPPGQSDPAISIYTMLARWMVFVDPPEHTRLRALVQKAFTPRVVETLGPAIQSIVDGLIDTMRARGEADLIADFAYPLPVLVISRMLGVPDDDLEHVKRWSDDLALVVFHADDVRDRHARAQRSVDAFAERLRALVRERRAAPREDLLSELLRAEERGDALSEDEVVATAILMIFAGHETTTNLVANGALALLEHPDQRARLRADPALMGKAIEEMLRFEGPSKSMLRVVAEDHEREGKRLRRGEKVLLAQCAANRDPERFDEPDRFDVGRDPNPHCGFGQGIHYCLGAPLARAEARAAFESLLTRLPRLSLAVPASELVWHPTILSRSLHALPVRF